MSILSPSHAQSQKIKDSVGEFKTLLRGANSFIQCNHTNFSLVYSPKSTDTKPSTKENILFLGLSYQMEIVEDLSSSGTAKNIYYIECLDYTNSLREAGIVAHIPAHYIPLTLDKALEILAELDLDTWDFYFYKQNLSLFPSFWAKALYSIEDCLTSKKSIPSTSSKINTNEIFLAAYSNDLLSKELHYAIEKTGYNCTSLDFKPHSSLALSEEEIGLLASSLRMHSPSLFLSINGRFLDSNGRIFYLLEHLKIPVALWIVDNVWNILSQFKSDFWKECPLFVTDTSFIPELEAHGAKKVHYMPLAGHEHGVKEKMNKEFPLLYVGYSEFKNKSAFFSAVKKDSTILDNYKEELNSYLDGKASLLDFNALYSRLSKEEDFSLWPRNDFRKVSYYSAELDIYHKQKLLQNFSIQQDISIIGDEGWKNILKEKVQILPPVDYYTSLQEIYSRAKFTLNIPSLLMPQALTQRHFDVWLAHGFLLSCKTNGLDIFPRNLVEAFCLDDKTSLNSLIERYTAENTLYTQIQEEMRAEIVKNHLYSHRIQEFIRILLG